MATDRFLTRLSALIGRYDNARRALQTRSESALRRIFNTIERDDWYQPEALQRNASQFARVVRAAQVQQANMTAAHLTSVMREIRTEAGEPSRARFRPATADPIMDRTPTVTLPDRLRDVDPLVEWERPAATFRWNVANGEDLQTASDRAWQRVIDLDDMDLQLADQRATHDVLSLDEKVIGWRRIIHPELSAGGVCGLCIAASDRRYTVEELRPIHQRCKCTVLPIYPEWDPGHSLNEQDLNELYKAADGNTAEKLKRTRFKVVEHGELGPMLVQQGRQFTDRDDAAARVSVDRRPEATQRREDDAQTFADSQPSAAAGGGGDEPPNDPPRTAVAGGADDETPHVLPTGTPVVAASAGSRGQVRRPGRAEIPDSAIADVSNPDEHFDLDGRAHEREIAEWLRESGRTVLSVAPGDTSRPDALVDDVPVEFKAPTSDAQFIRSIQYARHQAAQVVVWVRGMNRSQEELEALTRRVVGSVGGQLDEILVIGDGFELSWRHV